MGLSAAAAASRIGKKQAAWSAYERGSRVPNAVTVGAIADVLRCPVDALYEGEIPAADELSVA